MRRGLSWGTLSPMSRIRQFAFKRLLGPAARLYWRLTRPLTAGVRALVRDEKGHVLLVRHTYLADWYLPGGGVDRSETMHQAVRRELREETGLILHGEARLMGIYANFREFKSDHVALFDIASDAWERGDWAPDREIAEWDFFAPDRLPEDVSPGTRRRIGEALEGARPDEFW